MWVWRDEMTPESDRGGWRLDAYGTWTWEESSVSPRGYAAHEEARRPGARERIVSRGGDRALAAIGAPPPEYTPIFRAMSADRTRYRDDRLADVHVPEPHPGSGPLPVQDPHREAGPSAPGLAPVPTVPPPPADGLGAVSAEEELRRRAERRRRPRAVEPTSPAGGRHTLLPREDPPGGRHVLRR